MKQTLSVRYHASETATACSFPPSAILKALGCNWREDFQFGYSDSRITVNKAYSLRALYWKTSQVAARIITSNRKWNLNLIFMDPCIVVWLSRITNKMQPCIRIYYSTVHWRLNMFRAAHRSSWGALTVFAASGLHTHVVTGRSQVWVGTDLTTAGHHMRI